MKPSFILYFIGGFMGDISVLLEMRSRYLSFNPAFKKVADYFLNGKAMAYVPISEVTGTTGVSKATVSRFVQELGFSSYKDFQMELVRAKYADGDKTSAEPFGYSDVTISDTTAEIGRKVFLSNIKALEDTLKMVDFDVLEMMIQKLENNSRFFIYASGRSFVAADSIRKRLMRLDVNCSVYNDPHEQALASTTSKPGDLVLGISAFGRSSSVLRAMQRSKDKGAMVVGLTSYRGTPIERVATHMLYTATSDPILHSAEPSCTSVTHIALLDTLYMVLVMRNPGSVRELLQEGADAMEGERMRR